MMPSIILKTATRLMVGLILTFSMCGLGLALGSGLVAPLAGRQFLTGIWWIWENRQASELAIGTPLFFDIGVFFAVLGTILTLILALEEN